MSKRLKTTLALGKFRNANERSAWKRAMIGAELAASVVIKREPRDAKK
jgi:hypothetical protein